MYVLRVSNPAVAAKSNKPLLQNRARTMVFSTELSVSWIDPRLGLGGVASRVFNFFRWVGSTVPKVSYFMKIILN